MPIETIDELFEHELKDIYGAEQRLVEALDEMAGEALDKEQQRLFKQHKKETQGQIKRLEKVFKALGLKPEAQPCPGMEGLIKEKKSFMKEKPSEDILDFYNVRAAQKVERYEITAYEGLIESAEKMGLQEVADLLSQNLEEEEATLNKLKAAAAEYEVEEIQDEDDESEAEEEEAAPVASRGRGRTRR
jgi:ferritin-like metal-binding protein YciE